MPTNVTVHYAKAQEKYLNAKTREEKIAALEEANPEYSAFILPIAKFERQQQMGIFDKEKIIRDVYVPLGAHGVLFRATPQIKPLPETISLRFVNSLQTSLIKKECFLIDMKDIKEQEHICEYCGKKIHKIDYELNKGYCGKCRDTIEWKITFEHMKEFKE